VAEAAGGNTPHIDMTAILKSRLGQMQQENQELKYMLSILINKVGSPVILTDRDLATMPKNGQLIITSDEKTHSITMMFETQAETPEGH
jgi:hypothetical protein